MLAEKLAQWLIQFGLFAGLSSKFESVKRHLRVAIHKGSQVPHEGDSCA